MVTKVFYSVSDPKIVTAGSFRLQTQKDWVMSLPDSSPWNFQASFITYSFMDYEPGQLIIFLLKTFNFRVLVEVKLIL